MRKISESLEVHQVIRQYISLDRESPLPLWTQVRECLLKAIHHPVMEVSTRLPSEQDLCLIFGVSRPIIRMALGSLVSAGLITKVARQGIFIAPRKTAVDFASLNSGLFGEIAKGHKVTTHILSLQRISPSENEQQVLQLPPPADVIRLRRVYLVDDIATAVATLTLAGHKVPGIEESIQDNISVYAVLQDRYNLSIQYSERWFEAVMPSAEEARLLNIAVTQPLIAIESIGRTADGQVLEYYNIVYSTAASRIRITARSE